MHPRHEPQAAHAQHAGGIIQAGWNARIAALHRLQGHRTKAHQVRPHNAHCRGRHQRANAPLRHGGLQPAHGQQQPHHNHSPRHRIAQAGQLHHAACHAIGATAHGKGQRQRHGHGQGRSDAAQSHAVPGPFHKTAPGQHRPVGRQRPQHEGNRCHKTHQHRQAAHQPRRHAQATAQHQRLRL